MSELHTWDFEGVVCPGGRNVSPKKNSLSFSCSMLYNTCFVIQFEYVFFSSYVLNCPNGKKSFFSKVPFLLFGHVPMNCIVRICCQRLCKHLESGGAIMMDID
jgi:hypothetical protein